MKRIKDNYKVFIAIIVTFFITNLFPVVAYQTSINSSEVVYENNISGLHADNVSEALDNLYSVKTGTATADKVLKGYTFSNNEKIGVSGSMANNGSWVKTTSTTKAVTGGEGYYSKVSCAKAANSGTFTTSTNGSAVDMGANQNYRYVNTTGVYNAGVSAGKSASTASRVRLWSGSTLGNVSVNLSGYTWVYIKVTGGSTLLLQVNGAAGWVANDTTSPDGNWGSWVGARQFKATSSGITALSGTRCGTENHWGNVWLYITEVWGIKNLS